MVANRRFGPLILIVVFGFVGLFARLYQVQVEEHEIWAREAANLVRKAQTIPYLRGRILDRNGQAFVQDEESYAVRFVYREFRRNHPLGQMAHAHGALEGRHAGLPLAALNMESWGLQLVESSAGDLERFASGEAVRLCGIDYPQVEPGTDRRRVRAGEVRFYIRGLLAASRRDWNAIRKDIRKGRGLDSSWLELLAEREDQPVEFIRTRFLKRLTNSLERLQQLAIQLKVRSLDGLIPVTAEESLWFLIDALEVQRQEIENAIAQDLFLEATGFDPGRMQPELLLNLVDLHFIAEPLGWDPPRTAGWAERMHEVWLDNRKTFHIPRAQVSARLRVGQGEEALDALVGELGVLFARKARTPREIRLQSRQWRRIDELAVFSELPDLFEDVELAEGFGVGLQVDSEAPLPFFESSLRRSQGLGLAEVCARMIPIEYAAQVAREHAPEPFIDWRGDEQPAWRAPVDVTEAVERLLGLLYPEFEAEDPRFAPFERDELELVRWVENLWGARFQAHLADALERLRQSAESAGLALPLQLDAKRLKRAEKKADYIIRDRGSRPAEIDENPDDDVVNTLTRYVHEYQGFQIEPRTRRLAMALDSDGLLVARELIGVVRESTLEEVLEQQGLSNVFNSILHKEERGSEDREMLTELVNSLYRSDEVRGTSGIEGLMDNVLRGKNGFVESEGLQQREEGTRSQLALPKVDGHDIELTLSIELQTAAQNTIEHPSFPMEDDTRDKYWVANPVGAIVLATVDGEILAAASCPKAPHPPSSARDGERAYNYERTLRMPLFQPLGSIFKPFVAAYALTHCGLHPDTEFTCAERPGGGAGWGKVACWNTYGHGTLQLAGALHDSCNAYFAQVGELLESKENVRELAHAFGFDTPTGVRDVGTGRGLFEVDRIPSFHNKLGEREFNLTDLHRAANGLAVIEGTPVQVARAVAGLATGRLPKMRLVKTIDDVPVEASFEDIPLPDEALQIVREAMRGVISVGSAHKKGLSDEKLHFTLAGKTGSADYRPMNAEYFREMQTSGSSPQMRKHTWFIGYFPAEAPTNVVVVYCHDIGVTASHSAVYVAAQFLKSPEVQAYMKGAIR